MTTEDQHPDAGMDLMFGSRGPVAKDQRYRVGHPRIPRNERASVQMVGVLFLILALCLGVPLLVHIAEALRSFLHSIG